MAVGLRGIMRIRRGLAVLGPWSRFWTLGTRCRGLEPRHRFSISIFDFGDVLKATWCRRILSAGLFLDSNDELVSLVSLALSLFSALMSLLSLVILTTELSSNRTQTNPTSSVPRSRKSWAVPDPAVASRKCASSSSMTSPGRSSGMSRDRLGRTIFWCCL